MSPKETAQERAARMERAAAGRAEDSPRPRRLPPVRTKPVRTTVDMPPQLHRGLKRWTADAAETLEVTDVPLADVMRILVRRLLDDPDLNTVVLDDLRELHDW